MQTTPVTEYRVEVGQEISQGFVPSFFGEVEKKHQEDNEPRGHGGRMNSASLSPSSSPQFSPDSAY
ncbi:MAG: hypothetical protein EXR98_09620 [Gemmataceae bacterium]|nr:hypothetical protein [Gemmataceae bacterium]